MSDGLIKRLRDIGEEETGYGIRNEAADLIEQQAARIAELEAQIAPVAPAVDAQPVAWLVTSKRGLVRVAWTDKPTPEQLAVCEFDGDTVKPLYASAQSEGLRKDAIRGEALEEAAKVCGERAYAYEKTKAPGWHSASHESRQNAAAIRALSQKDPQ